MEALLAKRWVWWLPMALGLVPAWMAWRFTCRVPHADHLPVVAEPWLAWLDGAPLWTVLHERMNDSRLDVPKALHLLLVRFAHWNLRVESMVCVLIACGTAALTVWLIRNRPPGGRVQAWVLSVAATALILTPHAWMNWTFGVQICYAIVVFLTLSVVVLFQTRLPLPWRSLLAGLCAAAASHSFLNGWFAWLLGTLCLAHAVRSENAPRRCAMRAAGIWLLLFALTVAVFFPGFQERAGGASGNAGPLARLAEDPLRVFRFFLALLGAPLAEGWATWNRETRVGLTASLAPVIAAVMLLLLGGVLIAIVRQRRWEKGGVIFPYLILLLWGVANAAAVAAGRTGMTASDPFQSRYLAFTIWVHIGLLALLSCVGGGFWRVIRIAWLGVVAYGYTIGFIQGLRDAERDYHRNEIMAAACALRHAAPEPSVLDAVWSTIGPRLVATLDRLESLGLLHVPTVRDELTARAPRSTAGEGVLEGGKLIARGVFLRGWAIEKPSRDMVDAVVISFQREGDPEKWLGLAQRRMIRSRPARNKNSPAMEERIGWEYQTPTGTEKSIHTSRVVPFLAKPIPAGKITFRAYAFDLDGGTFSPLAGEFTAEIP